MERRSDYAASLTTQKPERKVIEKNRRNQMKFLFSRLFSLVPDQATSKGGAHMSDRVNEVIHYIEGLKINLDKIKDKKVKLSSKKGLPEYTGSDSHGATTSQSIYIQIHEMGPDADIVLITGLKCHSNFCDAVRILEQYSTEVVHAEFSISGLSIFHVLHKKIEASEMSRRLKELFGGSSENYKESDIHASPSKEMEASLNLWDFEICPDVWFKNA